MKRILSRHRAEILLGIALLVPFLAPTRARLGSVISSGLLLLPQASAAESGEDEGRFRDAYFRALLRIAELEDRLLAVGDPARLVRQDPAFFRRNPVRVEAAVIARDASPWRGSIVISAGVDAGVAVGQAVVVGESLVGVVHETGPLTAHVRLLGDAGQRTWSEILTADGRVEGYTAGTGGGDLRMHLVPAGAGAAGDPVFTGGGTEGVPRGLLLGVVREIGDENRDGLSEVIVRPAVDPRGLRIVNVLSAGR